MFLRKGQRVFLSTLGNKGFYYPTSNCEILIEDVEGMSMPWAGGGDKRAILVPALSVKGFRDQSGRMPVWIDKSQIV